MNKWEHKINGKMLRTSIDEGDSFGVLKELYQLTSRIINFKNVYYKYDFEELQLLLQEDIDLGEKGLLDYFEEEATYQSIVSYTDEKLEWFYDLCDKERVWITV